MVDLGSSVSAAGSGASSAATSYNPVADQVDADLEDVDVLYRVVAALDDADCIRSLEEMATRTDAVGEKARNALCRLSASDKPNAKNIHTHTIIAQQTDALCQRAATGDADCIRTLAAVATRTDAIGERAANTLFRLFSGAHEVDETVGKTIAAQCKEEFKERFSQGGIPNNLNPKFVYMAGTAISRTDNSDLHGAATDAIKRENALGSALDSRDEDPWDRGKFLTGEEVDAGLEAVRRQATAQGKDILILDAAVGTLALQVPEALTEEQRRASILFIPFQINPADPDNGHWQSLVIYTDADDGKRKAVLFDSDRRTGGTSYTNQNLDRLLALAGVDEGEFSRVERSLQEGGAPNACGAYTVEAARLAVSAANPKTALETFAEGLEEQREAQAIFNLGARRQLHGHVLDQQREKLGPAAEPAGFSDRLALSPEFLMVEEIAENAERFATPADNLAPLPQGALATAAATESTETLEEPAPPELPQTDRAEEPQRNAEASGWSAVWRSISSFFSPVSTPVASFFSSVFSRISARWPW